MESIKNLYNKAEKCNNALMNALTDLSERASKIYGQEIQANLGCDGEIEFRYVGEDYFVETTIEELTELEKNGKHQTTKILLFDN